MHVRAASANVVMDTITHQSLIILHIVIAVRKPTTCEYSISCHDCDGINTLFDVYPLVWSKIAFSEECKVADVHRNS